MGKKRKNRSSVAGGDSSADNSNKGTAAGSDVEASETATPPSKRQKQQDLSPASAKKPNSQKTSEELCEEFGLKNVHLEFTEADYLNLTNYGLFVRMVRPQVQQANPKIVSGYMSKLMEAKWREFREGNPLTKKRLEIEAKKKEAEEERRIEEQKKLDDARKPTREMTRKQYTEEDSEETEEDDGMLLTKKPAKRATAKKNIVEEDESEEEVMPKKKDRGSRVKTAMEELESDTEDDVPTRKSRRSSPGRSSAKSSPGRSSKASAPASEEETDDSKTEIDEVESEEDEPRRAKKPKKGGLVIRLSPLAKKGKGKKKKFYNSDSDDSHERRASSAKASEESEEEVHLSSRGRKTAKKPKYVDDSDEDTDTTSKRKRKKKKDSSDDDYGDSEDTILSDDDFIDDDDDEDLVSNDDEDYGKKKTRTRRKKRRQKTAPQRPSIPGERKSARSRQSNVSYEFQSDRDFEKMLKSDKKQLEEEKKKKEEKRANRMAIVGKKGNWQDDKVDSGEESDHYWYCEVCKDGGDLLLCDTCPKSYHTSCLRLKEDDLPEGEWKCPVCKGEELPEPLDEGDDYHDQWCYFCRDGGDVILCDFCELVFHGDCLNPPLEAVPEDDWKCPVCQTKENPLKNKVEKILTWRWSHQLKGQDEVDHTMSPEKRKRLESLSESEKDGKDGGKTRPSKRPERELFVKYADWSYWDCEWVPMLQVQIHQPTTFTFFKKKFDMDEPPALEDGSSFGRIRHRGKGAKEDDPYKLEERFYRYGIKPEWLQVHRVFNDDGNKGRNARYLVKWKDLPYEDATWEDPNDLPEGLEGFQKFVDEYLQRKKDRETIFKDKKQPKKANMRKKWEEDPQYIKDTGGKLHDYQLEGINWIRFSYAQDTNVILADEMGLGKTIQAASFVYSLWKEGYSKGPFLISAPLSTITNWEREFNFWAPELYVVTYVGGKENRAIIREHEFSYREGAFAGYNKPMKMRQSHRVKFDVLLTNYEIINVDSTTLNSIDWAVLVVDEAHRLKNQQSLFFRTLTDYSIEYRLLLTGTPLQNNLEELFNLLNFLQKGKFTDMEEFLSQFSDINKDEQVSKLHNMLGPHMLRRLKSDVLKHIPPKAEFVVRVDLAPMQKTFYKHILTKNFEALNVRGSSHQTTLMNIMIDLRKCCNHPYLFPSAEQDAPITRNGMFEITSLRKACGKLELLSKMLKVLKRQNHRVLIFSQMTRLLDLLEDFMVGEEIKYERIDGSISGKYRQEAIDRFNCEDSDTFVFLLSTRAGGLGINLATADTVIIYDQDWNPHNDIQAFSRAHRIGQKNAVMIFRFVSRNTVEEKITQVAKKKMALTELIIHRGMASVEKTESLSKKEVNDILRFGAENLFKDEDEEGKVVWDEKAVEKLLDRSQVTEVPDQDNEDEEKGGMNEYLRSFKVASYQIKTTAEEEKEEEEKRLMEEEEELRRREEEIRRNEEDPDYWQRLLGDAYQEHHAAELQEKERILASLGKGKRVRRQVNYAEADKGNVKIFKSGAMEEDYEYQPGNYSDYAPSSDEFEGDSETEEVKYGSSDEDFNPRKEKEEKLRTRRGQQEPRPDEKAKSRELPPLLKTVENHVEVLGFTPRQRKAFLDAIMRYGMPIEDSYKSQWLVRDLRSKHEKVFKAYVAMFMRHLCEPIKDESDTFADGVPREGLSRQHVLTRIGMMSLIRRKVHEFETINGAMSMKEFAEMPALKAKKAEEAAQIAATKTTIVVQVPPTAAAPASAPKDTKVVIVNTSPQAGKSAETVDGLKSEEKKEDKGNEKDQQPEDGDRKLGEKDDQIDDVAKANEDKAQKDNNTKTDSETGGKDEEGASDKESEPVSKDEDTRDSSTSGTKDSSAVSTRESSVISVDKSDEDSRDSSVSRESRDSDVEEVGDQVDGTVDDKEKKDEMEEKKTDDDTKEGESSVKTENGAYRQTETDKGETPEDMDATETKPVVKSEDKGEETEKESKVQEEIKRETELKRENNEKADGSEEKEAKSEKETSSDTKKKSMREVFYIADGGFTNLHALWQYEENLLKEGHQHEMWHRRHDYWLLAGIVTHGYRHWQDVLNDPRFEILNHAFHRETDKMKKGAFLNRRFQLLEQSLVIEEQMSKALRDHGIFKGLPTITGTRDRFSEIDELALALRRIANNGIEESLKEYESILNGLMTQLESLVGDIQQATYSMMPATLARAPATQTQKSQQQQQFHTKPIPSRPVHAKSNTVASLVGYRPQTSSQVTVTVRHQLSQREKGKDVITLD